MTIFLLQFMKGSKQRKDDSTYFQSHDIFTYLTNIQHVQYILFHPYVVTVYQLNPFYQYPKSAYPQKKSG